MSSYGNHVPSGRSGQPARIVPTMGARPTKATAAPSRPRRQSVPSIPTRASLSAASGAAPAPAAPPAPAPAGNGASETTPLLPPQPVEAEVKPRLHGLVGLNRPPTVVTEASVLVRSSVPIAAGLMLENALSTINALVVSRLGAMELAVCGNSSLLVMVTGVWGMLVI